LHQIYKRDMEMRRIFWGFCKNWFLMSPLHYLSGHPILASNSRRYSDSKSDSPLSPIRGVDDAPHHWYAESATPRITDTESWLMNFLKENSLYRWYGESSTPRTSDTVSRRLPVLLSRRVADSAYHRYGESTTPHIVESGVNDSVYRWYWESLFEKKTGLASIFSTLNG
jgi:hypothetical protein